jgi:hypothetical protein
MKIHVYNADGSLRPSVDWMWGVSASASVGPSVDAPDNVATMGNATAQTTGTISANVLHAMPFLAPPRGGTLDRLAFEVTSGATGNGRVGLYANVLGANDVYPGALVVDSGVIALTNALKTAAVSVALVPNALYWIGLVLSANNTCRTLPVGGVLGFLGIDASGAGSTPNTGITVSHAFAALPDPFTAAGAYITSAPPVLRYRFAA